MSRVTRPGQPSLTGVVHRNIRALIAFREQQERQQSTGDRIARAITRFAGSMPSVYLHGCALITWFIVNTGHLPGVRPFDPYPFVMLAMFASVEALFLSTFILISQNRQARIAERQAELDLQVNLLSEHEVTRLITMVDAIARKLDVPVGSDVAELENDVAPEAVLAAIEKTEKSVSNE